MLEKLKQDLQRAANPAKAKILAGFFKTGKGQYGEGDIFLGVTVPQQRAIARKYASLELNDIEQLLHSKIHEHRLTSLLILVHQYQQGQNKEQYVQFYLKNASNINNWDLVDSSAHLILGDYLLQRDRAILYKLATSSSLWERRISIVATWQFIRAGQYDDTINISIKLFDDKQDLIHKAVGWMLREVGKRDEATLKRFLDNNATKMPRTSLRYAIERLTPAEKKKYMEKR